MNNSQYMWNQVYVYNHLCHGNSKAIIYQGDSALYFTLSFWAKPDGAYGNRNSCIFIYTVYPLCICYSNKAIDFNEK